MQFCPACDNKLYMQIGVSVQSSQSNKEGDVPNNKSTIPLTLYCKHCPYKKEMTTRKTGADGTSTSEDDPSTNDERFAFDPCMSRSNYSCNHPLYFSTIVNEYTFDDPTLPCLSIPCQNEGCPSNDTQAKVDSEVLYVRYNDQDMKFMHLCRHCRQCWYTNDQGEIEVVFDFGKGGGGGVHMGEWWCND